MRGIMRLFKRAQISSLETILFPLAHGYIESFPRHILQTATAAAIQTWPAQRLAIAAAMTDTQTTILPQLALRAEATGRVNVSTETASADGTNPRRRAK